MGEAYGRGLEDRIGSGVASVKISRSSLLAVFVPVGLVFLGWFCLAGPVLLHTHILTKEDKSCVDYDKETTGLTVFNPFRLRGPERTADLFLRAASKSKCMSGIDSGLCNFVTQRRFRATSWWLANRWDWNSARSIRLFYKLRMGSLECAQGGNCAAAHVDLRLQGPDWQVVGFGFGCGPPARTGGE